MQVGAPQRSEAGHAAGGVVEHFGAIDVIDVIDEGEVSDVRDVRDVREVREVSEPVASETCPGIKSCCAPASGRGGPRHGRVRGSRVPRSPPPRP